LTRRKLLLPAPTRDFHLYVSEHNPGAEELVHLLQAEYGGWDEATLKVTTEDPKSADFWLLHLSRTMFDDQSLEQELLTVLASPGAATRRSIRWSQGGAKLRAPKLLLAHEQRSHRGGVPFDTIKAITPDELFHDRGIYKDVATPIFGLSAVHLRVSMRLLLEAMGARTAPSRRAASASASATESQGGESQHRAAAKKDLFGSVQSVEQLLTSMTSPSAHQFSQPEHLAAEAELAAGQSTNHEPRHDLPDSASLPDGPVRIPTQPRRQSSGFLSDRSASRKSAGRSKEAPPTNRQQSGSEQPLAQRVGAQLPRISTQSAQCARISSLIQSAGQHPQRHLAGETDPVLQNAVPTCNKFTLPSAQALPPRSSLAFPDQHQSFVLQQSIGSSSEAHPCRSQHNPQAAHRRQSSGFLLDLRNSGLNAGKEAPPSLWMHAQRMRRVRAATLLAQLQSSAAVDSVELPFVLRV